MTTILRPLAVVAMLGLVAACSNQTYQSESGRLTMETATVKAGAFKTETTATLVDFRPMKDGVLLGEQSHLEVVLQLPLK